MIEVPERMVEAGARGIYDAEPNYEDDPVTPWESVGSSTQNRYKEKARACLAAAFAGVEVVRVANQDDEVYARAAADGEDFDFSMKERDTLVIVRGW